MADFLGLGNIGGMFGGMGAVLQIIVLTIVIGIPLAVILGGLTWYILRKKKWNLKVEVKIPRGLKYLKPGETLNPENIEGLINAEWAKGYYSSKRGACYIKRKKKIASAIKPFDIKRYVQGNNILTVVQTGADTYAPVLPESYLQMVDDDTGEEAAILKTRMDISQDRAWHNQYERSRKNAYTIMGLLMAYKDYIGWGLIIFVILIGQAIIYSKVA